MKNAQGLSPVTAGLDQIALGGGRDKASAELCEDRDWKSAERSGHLQTTESFCEKPLAFGLLNLGADSRHLKLSWEILD